MTPEQIDDAMVWVEASYECGYAQGVLMGMPLGVAVCYGMIGMGQMIAVRERAKPAEPTGSLPCGARRPGDGLKCNLEAGHDEEHMHFNRHGRLRWA